MVSYCFEIPLGQSKSISCFMDFLNTVDIILKKKEWNAQIIFVQSQNLLIKVVLEITGINYNS